MKVKKCPARKNCFDYKDNNCDNCDFGKEFAKLHKRIDRLKKQNETLTIQRNAWYLTAERVGEDLQKAKAEVVRCKDCKNRYVPSECALWYGTVGDKEYFCERGDNFFCSYGERKE
jgi:hypothetical protein